MDCRYMKDEEFELQREVLRLEPYEAKLVKHYLSKHKENEQVARS